MLITAWCRWCAIYKKCCCIKDLWGPPHLLWPLLRMRNAKVLHDQTKSLSENHIYKNVFLCCWNRIPWAGKIKSKQCWDIKISQRGCEMRGISCRGSFSYHREGQPGSEEESIEVKLFSKQATLQVPSGCLIRQMLCVRRPSSNFIQLWALWALPCFSSAVWKCQHS